jgi:hypothetical protein
VMATNENEPRSALVRAGLFYRSAKICHGISCTTAGPGAYLLAHQALGGGDLKVTLEVVERIKRLRRLGRRPADIAQLCGLSEPTVRKVLKGAPSKESATDTQETWTEIDREDRRQGYAIECRRLNSGGHS